MFSVFEDEDFIQFKISTDMQHVDPLVQQAQKFFRHCNPGDDTSLLLILRELISNAFSHGNQNRENLCLMVSIEYTGSSEFKIMAEDEGSGFDHKNMAMGHDPAGVPKHGLGLVKSLCERIEFNDKGNSVSVWVKTAQNRECRVNFLGAEEGKEWAVVQPPQRLSGENTAKFRNVLLDLFNRGCRYYRFDIAQVEDMDSVSLSIFIKFSNLIREKHPDAELEIVNANQDIFNLMRMTCLNRFCRME